MEVLKVIIFIIAFFLITLLVYRKRSKKNLGVTAEKQTTISKPTSTLPEGRRINDHISHIINKDNEH